MARAPRIVYPGLPHHVTQRGTQRLPTFLREEDYAYYRALLKTFAERSRTKVIAWCLMPNHVHMILIPSTGDGLRATMAPLHHMFALEINRREGWTGHLWQDRFASFPLDESHTIAAARYIELNPVRAELVVSPDQYRWSSAISHVTGVPDGVTDLEESRKYVDDWRGLLASGVDESIGQLLVAHGKTYRPLGSKEWVENVMSAQGLPIHPRKRGRPKKK